LSRNTPAGTEGRYRCSYTSALEGYGWSSPRSGRLNLKNENRYSVQEAVWASGLLSPRFWFSEGSTAVSSRSNSICHVLHCSIYIYNTIILNKRICVFRGIWFLPQHSFYIVFVQCFCFVCLMFCFRVFVLRVFYLCFCPGFIIGTCAVKLHVKNTR
jgi:hypothetical protein